MSDEKFYTVLGLVVLFMLETFTLAWAILDHRNPLAWIAYTDIYLWYRTYEKRNHKLLKP